jgi:magnesium-transporting ATPase (P-type)
LTGESEPVRKQSEEIVVARVLQDKVNTIFSSTNVVTGAHAPPRERHRIHVCVLHSPLCSSTKVGGPVVDSLLHSLAQTR